MYSSSPKILFSKSYLSTVNYYTVMYFIVLTGIIFSNWNFSLPLCGTPVGIGYKGDPASSVLLYNMHDNENTSAVAGRIIASRYGGQYFELLHNGARNIGFEYFGDSLYIDPNRIYTDSGVWKQLERNQNYDTILFQKIVEWRDSLLSILRINERSLVIALHNNTNKFYSIASYAEGGEYEMDADTTHVGKTKDMDDFYFVTDSIIFEKLTSGRYNIVLQNNETVTDDGSLSVYCSRLGIPYINVETQHNHLVRQVKMLIFAFQKLVEE